VAILKYETLLTPSVEQHDGIDAVQSGHEIDLAGGVELLDGLQGIAAIGIVVSLELFQVRNVTKKSTDYIRGGIVVDTISATVETVPTAYV
jgi:hypothetical protein